MIRKIIFTNLHALNTMSQDVFRLFTVNYVRFKYKTGDKWLTDRVINYLNNKP